jgi:hypothetical protein
MGILMAAQTLAGSSRRAVTQQEIKDMARLRTQMLVSSVKNIGALYEKNHNLMEKIGKTCYAKGFSCKVEHGLRQPASTILLGL